ncbi:XTP/dITP diphosphohydrolase [Catalinimonas alkaloidigena]|uniref:dITP/XTP pyrophosphatase n=1 Tax=Catalinimonas alkaloidigena TaxID=1075417 RepID=A0A1G9DQ31_9BACT|nr:non-canonical purine NTP diphosphatase [Catalinimonas alkaloidigena]SDK65972.1 XTP/dITP diphosphohydrolase [Catalinimonas alkaloidigena]
MNLPQLCFATNNAHKLSEVRQLLAGQYDVVSLADIGCFDELPETQKTLEGNALQKARYVKDHFGVDCFADDTGLEVEALGGAPGVYSARYAGPARDSQQNMAKLLQELEGKPNRRARFRTCIALIQGNQELLFDGIVAGEILRAQRGAAGFGYDPVFRPEHKTRSFAEMPADEKNRISHRGRAVAALITHLKAEK